MKTVWCILLSIGAVVDSRQQHVKISTDSARFKFSLSFERGKSFSTNQHFQFESVTSKLFHTELSARASSRDVEGANAHHVIATSVHVEKMRNREVNNTSALALDSIVSVTFSDAMHHQPPDRPKDETATDLESILTAAVSRGDVLRALTAAGLVAEDTEALRLSFSAFDGSTNRRGVAATETYVVVSEGIDEGWPMFAAGAVITLLFVSIVGVGMCLCRRKPKPKEDKASDSVHFEGDVDLEAVTTASGVLGLKGHHPQSDPNNDENKHPNRRAYRKRRGAASSTKTDPTADASTAQETYRGSVASAFSKHQLGITSMRKLETFLTPQKPKTDRLCLYDVERLTRT